MDLASTVMSARRAARKHVVGWEASPAEKALLPKYVLDAISTLPRNPARYRSAYLDYPLSKPRLVQVEMPEQVEGFHRVIAAIAKRHRRSAQTLYRWELALQEMLGTLQPRELRPLGIHARHKRRPVSPPASFPVCDVPSERLPNTNLTRRPIGPECWGEDWDDEWVLVTAPRKYAKHLRAVGGRWNREELGWFVERPQMASLIKTLKGVSGSRTRPAPRRIVLMG
jgi:hypothetical protein